MVGYPVPVLVAVFIHVRLCVRLYNQNEHYVHNKCTEIGVRFQQHSPRAVHTDPRICRVQRCYCHTQPNLGRGGERFDIFGSAPRHRGPGTESRGRPARHKRNNCQLLY